MTLPHRIIGARDRSGHALTGIEHEHIDAAPGIDDGPDEVIAAARVGAVGWEDEGWAGQFCCDPFQIDSRPRVQGEVMTIRGKSCHDCLADAPTGTGHKYSKRTRPAHDAS